MSICSEILKDLRSEQGLTQKELAERLGTTRGSVNGWEMGLSVPSLASLVEMSRQFNVTLDYLAGIEDREYLCLTGLAEECKNILYQTADCFRRCGPPKQDSE